MYPYENNLFLLPDSAKFHIFSFLDETEPLQKVSRRFRKYHDAFIFDITHGKSLAEGMFGKMALQIKTVNNTWQEVYKTCFEIILEKNRSYPLPVYTSLPKRSDREREEALISQRMSLLLDWFIPMWAQSRPKTDS